MNDNLTKEQQHADGYTLKRVEELWLLRMLSQDIRPSTKRGGERETEFFAGAMAALTAMGYTIPPRWAVPIMSGRSVTDAIKKYHE